MVYFKNTEISDMRTFKTYQSLSDYDEQVILLQFTILGTTKP